MFPGSATDSKYAPTGIVDAEGNDATAALLVNDVTVNEALLNLTMGAPDVEVRLLP